MENEDRLSDLPTSVLLHILSLLPNRKEVVRTSVLAKQWRFLWRSVPVSLHFRLASVLLSEKEVLDFVASTHRELHYWRSCEKVAKFRVDFRYDKRYAHDIDLWVYFATQVAQVEDFTLRLDLSVNFEYVLPPFAYNQNTYLTNLYLRNCQLNPTLSVNWPSLVSLSIGRLKLTDTIMEIVLTGCPNLESLEIDTFWGIHRIEIRSVKMRKLMLRNYDGGMERNAHWLNIVAPYVEYLQVFGLCDEIHFPGRNVASLVSALLDFTPSFKFGNGEANNWDRDCTYLKELLQCLNHVKNIELGPWCIEFLSILELKGWQSPPSSWKVLTINTALGSLDLPGICSLLKSSSDLETMIIDWDIHKPRYLFSAFTSTDEHRSRFETHDFNCPSLQLKTIKMVHLHGPLRESKFVPPLVEYLLRNALVLEKLIIVVRFEDDLEMEQELLSFPKSSPHASVVFSYQ